MTGLAEIEGIGPSYADRLKAAGIGSVEALLEAGATPRERAELTVSSGISETLILRWVNMADLFRIKGIGEQYSDLLEAAGVDTVPELAQRNPDNLCASMLRVNDEKKLVRQVPTATQVAAWVEEAKKLPRVVTY